MDHNGNPGQAAGNPAYKPGSHSARHGRLWGVQENDIDAMNRGCMAEQAKG